jgi:FMN phosphatase YigB (HAD superfamily)
MSLFGGLELVLFDLDGTLVRTSSDYVERFLGVCLDHFGISWDKVLARRLWFDDDRSDIVRGLGVDPKLFWGYYNQVEDLSFRSGAISLYELDDPDFVSCLGFLGLPRVVVTGASRVTMDLELDFFGGGFERAYSTNQLGVRKREVIVDCLDRFGVSRNKAVFVGNSDGDVREARAAGVKSVLIDRKEYPVSERSDYRIGKLYELLRI